MERYIAFDRASRRRFLQAAAAMGLLEAWRSLLPAYAQPTLGGLNELRVGGGRVADLVIARTPFRFGGREGSAVTINGTVPGPLLRFREGETVTLRVTNRLEEDTSIHWHGILVPTGMDGVPGISFPGIKPGETFIYEYPVRQNGTYWYHSHSKVQEQAGHYAPLVIEPADRDPVAYDHEHVVVLSDWTFMDPHRAMLVMKKQSDYFNFQRRTVGEFFRDVRKHGWAATLNDRKEWGEMRMSPTDILDVTASTYTYLVNGMPPEHNWTGLFRSGERVRLRFINASASTFFNVRIPGLPLSIAQADGQNVRPVSVDEFQIGVAETYDVVVQPQGDRAYTVFAEAMDRSGYGRGTLAPRAGMTAPVPALRERPLRTMIDMGMDMKKMSMPEMEKMKKKPMAEMPHGGHDKPPPGMAHGGKTDMLSMERAGPIVGRHGPDKHGPLNITVAKVQRNRLGEPGTGLEGVGHRVLVYNDLKALEPSRFADVPVTREIEMHLTGNMEVFSWGMDGKKFSEAKEPFYVQYGERVRVTMVNDTMMEHPMHLHGAFMELDNGGGARMPRKHTINVKPSERLSFEMVFDEPGNFIFHCHFLYHLELGMLRFFNVSYPPEKSPA